MGNVLGIFIVIELISLITGWYSLKTGVYIGLAAAAVSLVDLKGGAGGALSSVGNAVGKVWGIVISIIILPLVVAAGMILWKYIMPGAENSWQFYSAPLFALLLVSVGNAILGGGANIRGWLGFIGFVGTAALILSVGYDWITDTKKVESNIRPTTTGPSLISYEPTNWRMTAEPGDFFEADITGEASFLVNSAGDTNLVKAGGEVGAGNLANGLPVGAAVLVVKIPPGTTALQGMEIKGKAGDGRVIISGTVPQGVSGIIDIAYNYGGVNIKPITGWYRIKLRKNPLPIHDYRKDAKREGQKIVYEKLDVALLGENTPSRTLSRKALAKIFPNTTTVCKGPDGFKIQWDQNKDKFWFYGEKGETVTVTFVPDRK